MPNNEKKKKYDIEYAKNNLKRIPLDVSKIKYQEIKNISEEMGESVNGFIKKAIEIRISDIKKK